MSRFYFINKSLHININSTTLKLKKSAQNSAPCSPPIPRSLEHFMTCFMTPSSFSSNFFSMHEDVLQPQLFQTAEAEMFPIGNIENLYA